MKFKIPSTMDSPSNRGKFRLRVTFGHSEVAWPDRCSRLTVIDRLILEYIMGINRTHWWRR